MKKTQRNQQGRAHAAHVAATGAASGSARAQAATPPPRSPAGGAPKAARPSTVAGVAKIFRSETAKAAFAGCSPTGGAGVPDGRGATGQGPGIANADIVALASRAWLRPRSAEARHAGPAPLTGLGVEGLLAARGQVHGEFSTQAAAGQALKAVFRSGANWATLSDVQVDGLEMIACKIARILSGDPNWRDHWDDIAGYATLVAERLGPPRGASAPTGQEPAFDEDAWRARWER